MSRFFVLNTIQLYELRTVKLKGGFYTHVVFDSTYLVLTKYHRVYTKRLFPFGKKNLKNALYLPQENYCNQCLYLE